MKRNGLITMLLAGLLLTPAFGQQDAYLATAITKVGDFALPEKVDDLARTVAKHLVQFKWGPYSGSKTRVTVLPVENTSSVASYSVDKTDGEYQASPELATEYVPLRGIESLITDALFQTGRFRVLERETLGQQFKEQDLGKTGRISKPSAAKVGKTLGSEVNIKLKITNYEPNFKNKKVGAGRGFLGGVSVGVKRSQVIIVFQLIDVTTSEILFSKKVQAEIGQKGLSMRGIGGKGGAAFSSFSKTPIGQAVIAAINVGAFELVKAIGSKPASGTVMSVDGTVAINIGSKKQVAVGDQFKAMSKGKELIDPETGISLGSRTKKVGMLEIVETEERFSFAKPVDFDITELKKGDKVVATKAPSSLRFAEKWGGPKGKKLDKKKKRNRKKYKSD